MRRTFNAKGGSIASLDGFAGLAGIRSLIDVALTREGHRGATFDKKKHKAAVIQLTRNAARSDDTPCLTKGKELEPKSRAKSLGVIIDMSLRYKQQRAGAGSPQPTKWHGTARFRVRYRRKLSQTFSYGSYTLGIVS